MWLDLFYFPLGECLLGNFHFLFDLLNKINQIYNLPFRNNRAEWKKQCPSHITVSLYMVLIVLLQRYLFINMEYLHKVSDLIEPWCEQITDYVTDNIGTDIGLSFICEEGSGFYLLLAAILAVIVLIVLLASLFKSSDRNKTFLSKLLEVKEISHDTKIFTFGLPNYMNTVGLNIGEHLELEAEINGRTVQRKYTPISRADLKRNSFELLVKVYFPLPPQFPEGGLMSQHVNSLKIGEEIKVTLPYGRFNYLGKSNVQIRELSGAVRKSKVDHIYMVGGGTGITPLYQIIQYVTEAEQASERPDLTLLFANRTEDDILVKGELEAFARQNPTFKCHFSVDKSINEGWKGFVGFINDDKIGQTLGGRKLDNSLFVVCGPPILCNIVEKSLAGKFNVKAEQFFRF